MGGGGNPWDIPPFNWYGKGVIKEDKLNTATLSHTTALTGNETLSTLVNITGSGCLHYSAIHYTIGTNDYLIKITLDDKIFLFKGYQGSFSESGYVGNIVTYPYIAYMGLKFELSNLSLGLTLPNSTLFITSKYNEYHAFATPIIFNKSLKIEAATSNLQTSFLYIYDLFEE